MKVTREADSVDEANFPRLDIIGSQDFLKYLLHILLYNIHHSFKIMFHHNSFIIFYHIFCWHTHILHIFYMQHFASPRGIRYTGARKHHCRHAKCTRGGLFGNLREFFSQKVSKYKGELDMVFEAKNTQLCILHELLGTCHCLNIKAVTL